jgi:hypothetical protein
MGASTDFSDLAITEGWLAQANARLDLEKWFGASAAEVPKSLLSGLPDMSGRKSYKDSERQLRQFGMVSGARSRRSDAACSLP